tara:strand:+ start:140 stop:502 length:363 start_codon:yes stop_codon:yes gene_type:complete
MSKFSELAGLDYTTHESGVSGTTAPPVQAAPPVVDEPPRPEEEVAEVTAPPVYENPLDDMPVATEPEVPPVAEAFSPDDLQWMSKIKLEEIGRSFGIELDRRLSQPKLVKQLKEHIKNTQ